MTKKKILVLLVLAFALAGCSKAVSYKISEDFQRLRPLKIIVMPVTTLPKAVEAEVEGLKLIRMGTVDKLREKNYFVFPTKRVDEALKAKGLDNKPKQPAPQTLAPLFNADGVLYSRITQWDKVQVASYAALKMGAEFMLYAKDGSLLWKGSFNTKESDFRLDGDATELSILKAFEPRVQRIVDAVFLTLPLREIDKKNKEYYQWLP